jgi:hypothetical protein
MTKEKTQRVTINPPNFKTAAFGIVGTAPLIMNNFSQEALDMMKAKQEAGSQSRKGKKREAKDFDANYEGAFNRSDEGWPGIPCIAFRKALVSACRLVGFRMTIAKLSIFVEADGMDTSGFKPLVKIEGTPERTEMYVKNETGVADIRVRPMFRSWSAVLRVKFDLDQFSVEDVANLILRAGIQVGIGTGRPDSTNSCGQGWGTWTIGEKA